MPSDGPEARFPASHLNNNEYVPMLFEEINLKEKPLTANVIGYACGSGCIWLIYYSSSLWLPFLQGDWAKLPYLLGGLLSPLWGAAVCVRGLFGPLRYREVKASPQGVTFQTWLGNTHTLSDPSMISISDHVHRRMSVLTMRAGHRKIYILTTLENSAMLQAIMQTWDAPSSTAA